MEQQEQVVWNVLTDPWLEVKRLDARIEVISPQDALRQASDIQTIRADSPLDVFAGYRFLLTLLYWKANTCSGINALREQLLGGNVPQGVLEAIAAEAGEFNLFDSKKPFLQDPDLRKEKLAQYKSSGSFFMEFSCGTNVAHFHHGDDDSTRLCLGCLTAGMMRVIPWTQAGGRGLTKCVHGDPPIRLLAVGGTLGETLGLNLVPFDSDIPAGTATWSGAFKPCDFGKPPDEWSPIAYMEALTWNPRLLWIPAPEKGHTCWRCGASTESYTVGRIVYKKNENTKRPVEKYSFVWRDPAAFYLNVPPDATKKERDLEYETARSGNERNAFFEIDVIPRLFPEKGPRPVAMLERENPEHHGWELFIPSTMPGKRKTYDVRMIRLDELSRASLEQIRLDIPEKIPKSRDGWRAPQNPRQCSRAFIQSTKRLMDAEWACFASANSSMDQSPEAFDLFSGIYWNLRNRKRALPSRQVAWMMLKLMASVPAKLRIARSDAEWSPLDKLKTRQPLPPKDKKKNVLREYPRTFPNIHELEVQLREILQKNTRSRNTKTVNWGLLADQVNYLLG